MLFPNLKTKTRIYSPAKILLFAVVFCMACQNAQAEDNKKPRFDAPRHYAPSTNMTGVIGLNTIPTARMDERGTVRVGVSTDEPYTHSFMGFQIAKPLYVSFRQSAQTKNITAKADNFYPGIDFKLRLREETAHAPAIAIGADSGAGTKRLASEYITLSKRFKNFDLTGGMAWGRLGSAAHIKNPLGAVSPHFDRPRNYNSLLETQTIEDWFTGEDVGFFGGVEYFTPLKNLSLKADYGANEYIGEQTIAGFSPPAPWALSLNYQPIPQVDISAGVIGGEQFMARISLQENLLNWAGKSYRTGTPPDIISPRAPDKEGGNTVTLALNPYSPTAYQIGRATRKNANEMESSQENITLALHHKGLKGPVVTLMRSDLEQAVLNNQGSPEEIWQDATIAPDTSPNFSFKKLLDLKNFSKKDQTKSFHFVLDQKLGLSEADTGTLYRTAILLEGEKVLPFGLVSGATGRINVANNLDRLQTYRFRIPNAVRSDEDLFASNRFGIDRFYSTWLKSLSPSTHMALSFGYLEEMYGGYGGEILYRPFGKTFAVGTEGWKVHKRDPDSKFAKTMNRDGTYTGHLNLYYELPKQDMTAYLKLGQYLREDRGGTLGVINKFDNGSSLEAYATVTNQTDTSFFANKTNLFGGVRFNLPLGNIPYIMDGTETRLATEPFARDSGQILDNPQALYKVTEPIAYRSVSQSWKHLLD